MSTVTIFRLLCLVIVITVAKAKLETVSVKTNIGVINGFAEDVTFREKSAKVHKYLGIPFAEPPTGDLRFRKPVPKAPLEKPLDAFRHKSACSQANLGLFRNGEIIYEEDCLYLNIYAPERKKEDPKLAVMVWIYGGGFTFGFSDMYIGDNLVVHGDVIVVTVNYRLSVWGFLTTGDKVAPGNYGLWDQHLAFNWVHDNIDAFGGDINRVTIFGESAGSASVLYHALYPGNKGLFQRVIGQSGSVGAFWGSSKANADTAKKLGSAAGCETEDLEALMTCLRDISSDQLEEIVSNATNGFLTMPFPFLPTFDGDFVTTSPKQTFSRGSDLPENVAEFFSSLNVLSGVVAKEGSIALSPFFGVENPEEFLPNRTYFADTLVPRLLEVCFEDAKDPVVADAATAEYTNWDNPEEPLSIRAEYISMWGDASFTAELYKTLDTHVKFSSRKNTYMYVFDVEPEFSSFLVAASWCEKMGHGEDLPYVFGFKNSDEFKENYHILPTPWEEEVSAGVMTLFSNFAKTGNPNSPNDLGLDWIPYTRKHQHYLQITRDMTSSNVKQRWNTKRANFWANLLPKIIKSTRCEGTKYSGRQNQDTCEKDESCSP